MPASPHLPASLRWLALVLVIAVLAPLLASCANRQPVAAPVRPVANQDAADIDKRVADVLASRQYGTLPAPQSLGTNRNASHSEIEVRNESEHRLTVLYSGPTSQKAVLAPNGSEKVILAAGKYKVVAMAESAPNIRPFVGDYDLTPGSRHSSRFFVRTTTTPAPAGGSTRPWAVP